MDRHDHRTLSSWRTAVPLLRRWYGRPRSAKCAVIALSTRHPEPPNPRHLPSSTRTTALAPTRNIGALGGLSMGGIQILNIDLHNLGTFRSLVVMSSGWFPDDRDAFFSSSAARMLHASRRSTLSLTCSGDIPILRAITP